jgi:hypothetical protein
LCLPRSAAADTANLAAFITISAKPTMLASSLDELYTAGSPLCMYAGGHTVRFDAAHGQRHVYTPYRSKALVADDLMAGTCAAVVAPRNVYLAWRTQPQYCSFRVVQSIVPSKAGWMAARESVCVRYAFEWALTVLETNGTVDNILRRHFAEAPCASTSGSSGGCGGIGRRLHGDEAEQGGEAGWEEDGEAGGDSGGEGGGEAGWKEATEEGGRDAAWERGRRLSTAGGGAHAEGAGGGSNDVMQMGLVDFSGIFLAWGTKVHSMAQPLMCAEHGMALTTVVCAASRVCAALAIACVGCRWMVATLCVLVSTAAQRCRLRCELRPWKRSAHATNATDGRDARAVTRDGDAATRDAVSGVMVMVKADERGEPRGEPRSGLTKAVIRIRQRSSPARCCHTEESCTLCVCCRCATALDGIRHLI